MRFVSTLFRRAALAGCALALALTAAGCGNAKLNTFTWEVEAVPANLDPQTVQASADVIAVTHLYSGLYRLDENGQPQPDSAESCTVSPDGLTYTFTLKEDLTYLNYRNKESGGPVPARDFVFGLQRVFLPETASPYARPLGNIKNGTAVAEGRMSPDQLGVSAPDDRTVVIQLEQPDDNFLAKLCLPGAMPCSQELFEESRGTYGLSSSTVMGNGPFYLYNWTSGGLFLRRPDKGGQINNLRLVLGGSEESPAPSGSSDPEASSAPAPLTPQQKIENDKVSAALSAVSSGGSLNEIPYTAATWVLLYNCQVDGLNATPVRQGLTASAAQVELAIPESFSPAQGLIPPEARVNGKSYRESAGSALFRSDDPLALYKMGLAQAGLEKLSGITVLVPEGKPAELFSEINQQWQKQLSAFFSVRELPLAELQEEVRQGNFQIALLPLFPTESDPLSLMDPSTFVNGWHNGSFEKAYRSESQNYRLDGRADRIAELESQLIIDCPLAPLFHETCYLLVDPTVEGLVFDPFGPILDLSGATR